MKSIEFFARIARSISNWLGSVLAFGIATLIIIIWALTGPIFHYSDTWQLLINTGTTIITFLMVFLIQYAQNKDAKSINLKLDELILKTSNARNRLLNLESCTDKELEILEKQFKKIKKKSLKRRY